MARPTKPTGERSLSQFPGAGGAAVAATGLGGATPAEAAAELVVLERAESYVLAAWRRLFFLAWKGPANATGIDRCRTVLRTSAAKAQQSIVLVNVIGPSNASSPPDEAARAALSRAMREPSPWLSGIATLYEGEGFKAAFVRSLLAGAQHLQRSTVPLHVFSSPRETAVWVNQILGERYAPEVLRALVDAALG